MNDRINYLFSDAELKKVNEMSIDEILEKYSSDQILANFVFRKTEFGRFAYDYMEENHLSDFEFMRAIDADDIFVEQICLKANEVHEIYFNSADDEILAREKTQEYIAEQINSRIHSFIFKDK